MAAPGDITANRKSQIEQVVRAIYRIYHRDYEAYGFEQDMEHDSTYIISAFKDYPEECLGVHVGFREDGVGEVWEPVLDEVRQMQQKRLKHRQNQHQIQEQQQLQQPDGLKIQPPPIPANSLLGQGGERTTD